MNAKTLLLTTTALVGMIAQSTPATETITLTAPPGFCLLANQLNHERGNRLDNVLPHVPLESQVLKFANNHYTVDIFDGAAWLNFATGNPSTTMVSPGEGFFFFNPTSQQLQIPITGNFPQRNLSVCFYPGFSLVSSPVPAPGSFVASNGFPQVLEMQILRFDSATQRYRAIINVCPFFGQGDSCWVQSETGEPADTTSRRRGILCFQSRSYPALLDSWVLSVVSALTQSAETPSVVTERPLPTNVH